MNAKEALLYDIFFFNQNDKVMNIEPAILFLMHIMNIGRLDQATHNLEFILAEIEKYEKITGSEGKVRGCVTFAFEVCQKVGVSKYATKIGLLLTHIKKYFTTLQCRLQPKLACKTYRRLISFQAVGNGHHFESRFRTWQ